MGDKGSACLRVENPKGLLGSIEIDAIEIDQWGADART